jgi:hypothetical protein
VDHKVFIFVGWIHGAVTLQVTTILGELEPVWIEESLYIVGHPHADIVRLRSTRQEVDMNREH